MNIVRKIKIPEGVDFVKAFGPYDQYLKLVRDKLSVKIIIESPSASNREVRLSGAKKSVLKAQSVIQGLLKATVPVTEESVLRAITAEPGADYVKTNNLPPCNLGSATLDVFALKPRTEGQANYFEVLQVNDVVIAIGPAGTGKTYLAVARALMALKRNEVRKIILCRPAVEAGEKLGFLPGDYQAKVNPYLRPLYDALNSFIDYQQLRRLMETEIIEVVPLAYMRGRNLDNAFMILDEAQNATSEQMKMFLTRMGQHSKVVVTGDVTQIDLPPGKVSGLVECQSILANLKGITICYLTRADIVRHHLVQLIVDAYDTRRHD